MLSCDGLVVITNELATIIEDTRLSCDGPVIIAQPDRTRRTPSQYSLTLLRLPAIPHYSKLLVEN